MAYRHRHHRRRRAGTWPGPVRCAGLGRGAARRRGIRSAHPCRPPGEPAASGGPAACARSHRGDAHRPGARRPPGGPPATALLDEANALKPDLLVIGSRGHGPMATVLLGSVSTEVADHAPCPVLVARRPSVHRMIVAGGGSESAQRAVATLSAWPIFGGLAARVVA